MQNPTVSLITVNWNTRELLAACLSSLRRQALKGFETSVVDHGSTDCSVEFVRAVFPEAGVIAPDENLGFSAAYNIDIRHMRSKYIALLNSDTEVEPRWLEELMNALAGRIFLSDEAGITTVDGGTAITAREA